MRTLVEVIAGVVGVKINDVSSIAYGGLCINHAFAVVGGADGIAVVIDKFAAVLRQLLGGV